MTTAMRALLAALCASLWASSSAALGSTSSAGLSSLRPLADNSSLFALIDWRSFERQVLSEARGSPVTLLLVDAERGIDCSDADEREWGEAALFPSKEADEEAQRRLQECQRRADRHQIVLEAVIEAAKARSTPFDPVVLVPRDKLPQAFDYVSWMSGIQALMHFKDGN